MNMRSILLFAAAESADPARGAPALAIGLAQAMAARLTIFTIALDVTSPGVSADAPGVAGAISGAAEAAGIDCQVVTEHSHALGVHEVIAEHARLHDLIVTGCASGAILGERQVAEHLLFDSGRPVLVVPADHAGGWQDGTVVAGWDNTRAAARALGDALPLIRGELVLLTIDGDKQLPGDIDSDALVQAMGRRGFSARYASVAKGDREIARALQEEAKTAGAALLVMGGFGHSRLHRFVLGSATSGVFANPAMPILLSH